MKRKRLIRAFSCGMIALLLGIAVMALPASQVLAEQATLTAADGEALSSEPAKRTVMLYLCGSDLESGAMMATHNLKQILGSKFSHNGDVNFIIMTGGCKRWYLGNEYLADPSKPINRKRNQYWEATEAAAGEERGKLTLKWQSDTDASSETEAGKKELMSNPQVLKDFIDYCVDNYPAEKYDLILWDHGEGPLKGFGLDKHDETEAMMSFPDIIDALSDNKVINPGEGAPRGKFDFIDFDACLMSTVELNLAVAGLTDCYIASADVEPGFGQDYRGWLKAVGESPEKDPYEVGKIIVDDYVKFYESDEGFGQVGTLAVVNTNALLQSGFVEALNQMNGAMYDQVTTGTNNRFLYYDELGSVDGSIVYGPGRDTYRDFGNLVSQLCVPLRESVDEDWNEFEEASRTICGALANEDIIYARCTAGFTADPQLHMDGNGQLQFSELQFTGMYIFIPTMNGSAEAVDYREKMLQVASSVAVEDEASRLFLTSYPETTLRYALLAEAGKAVSQLAEKGVNKEVIDYQRVEAYWNETKLPVLGPWGEKTGETTLWAKNIEPILSKYDEPGERQAVQAWLQRLIGQQAGDAISKANTTAKKVIGKSSEEYRVTIGNTSKRIIEGVDKDVIAELPVAKQFLKSNPGYACDLDVVFKIGTVPGSMDIGDLDISIYDTPEEMWEKYRAWYESPESNWILEKGTTQAYALKDAAGVYHAVQAEFRNDGTAKVCFKYSVEEPDDSQEGAEATKQVDRVGTLIFKRDGSSSEYKLSQLYPTNDVAARPITVESLGATVLTDAQLIFMARLENATLLIPMSDTARSFTVSSGNADSIRLVLAPIDAIEDLGDIHEKYVVRDMYHHEVDITDKIQAAEEPGAETLTNIDMAEVESVTYNGQVQGPKVVYNGATLREGVDYTWTRMGTDEPRNPGEYTVTLIGKGDFAGSVVAVYTIEPASIQDAEVVLSPTSFAYNGKACIPDVKAIGGKTLVLGTDYTMQVLDSNGNVVDSPTEVGTYTVVITGIGGYTGTTRATYEIVARKAMLTFDLAGGTLNGQAGTVTIEANVGDVIDIPQAPSREGYTFKYWKGSEYYPGDKYAVEGDHTFTAVWERGASGTAAKGTSSKTGDGSGALAAAAAVVAAASLCAVTLSILRRNGKARIGKRS